MLLGAFVKGIPLDLLWPRPSRPFNGLSFMQISRIVHHLKSPCWYPTCIPYVDAVYEIRDDRLFWEGGQSFTAKKRKCKKCSRFLDADTVEAHGCTLQALLVPELAIQEASIQGLEL